MSVWYHSGHTYTDQWRIPTGRQPQRRVRQSMIWQIFDQKLHENLPRGYPSLPPVGFATADSYIYIHSRFKTQNLLQMDLVPCALLYLF